MKRCWRAVVVLLVSVWVSGCGGGGGDGEEVKPTVASDREEFNFVSFNGAPVEASHINLSLRDGGGTYYGSVQVDRPGLVSASFFPAGDTVGTVTLRFNGTPTESVSGVVVFRLCHDSGCGKVAWEHGYAYHVEAYTVDTTSLTFTGHEGAVATPQVVSLTPSDAARPLAVTSNSPWLSVARDGGGRITVTPSAANLAAGSHQANVTLARGTASLVVPVSFTVGSGIVVAPEKTFDLRLDSGAASLSGTSPVTFQAGRSPAWTATSNQPWLQLTQASGTGAGQVRYAVDASQLALVPNGDAVTAQVTVQAAGLAPAAFPVTVRKQLPEVSLVTSSPVRAGAAVSFKVIGRGFSQLTPERGIAIEGVAGVVTSVISDTEARVTAPAIAAAGRYGVSVPNASGIASAAGSLVVVAPAGFTATSVPDAGEKHSSLFDTSRNAVFAAAVEQQSLVRYRWNGAQWSVDRLAVDRIGGIGLTLDKRTLYVTSGDYSLLAVDPDTLEVKTTFTVSPALASLRPRWVSSTLQSTADQRVWFTGSGNLNRPVYFDVRKGTFEVLAEGPLSDVFDRLDDPIFAASGDGSTMFMSQGYAASLPSYAYAVATGRAVQLPDAPRGGAAVQMDRTGTRLLMNRDAVYDVASSTLLGRAEPANGLALKAVLSPDGSRLFLVVTAGPDTFDTDHVEVFDTTQQVPGTTRFVKLGDIPLANQAHELCNWQVGNGCPGFGSLSISDFGDTLFWAGNERLVVIPVPSNLVGPLAATRLRNAAR